MQNTGNSEMLAAADMAWGWCQHSRVTLRSLRAAMALATAPERLPPDTLWCRGPIFHTQPIPALSQTRPESPPERGSGRQSLYRGCVHGLCVRGPGGCAQICVRGHWGSWGALAVGPGRSRPPPAPRPHRRATRAARQRSFSSRAATTLARRGPCREL